MRNLLLLAATLPPLALSIPTGSHHDSVLPTLRSLRNTIIETIWGVPPSSSHARTSKPCLPSNFRKRYGEDVVLRFTIRDGHEALAISQAAEILYLDVWESTADWIDIRIAKNMLESFLGLLPKSMRNSHRPLMHDLAQTVYETHPYSELSSTQTGFAPSSVHGASQEPPFPGRELFFQEYQPLSVIYPWLRLMASIFPDFVTRMSIGVSNEGREIAGLRVGTQPLNTTAESKPRKTLLITGGSHAREWISISTVNYIAYSLITRYGKFGGVTKFLDNYDIIFIPTINPDGYSYTWETDRLWRKNRQKTTLPFCCGVDLDRAFGYEWDGASTKDNPCSETYAGNEAFAGTEAMRLSEWARNQTENNNVEFVSFLDFHSYSQQVLYPYSYSCASIPSNLEDLEEVAMGLAKGFRLSNNRFYGVSSACEGSITTRASVMDVGGGSALDWFYHELKVKYSYQIKLRDTGSYGFLLPRNNIVPTGQESFNAVMNLASFLLGHNGIERAGSGIDWEEEYIMPNDRKLPTENTVVGLLRGGEGGKGDVFVEEIFNGDADEEEFNAELRRRR